MKRLITIAISFILAFQLRAQLTYLDEYEKDTMPTNVFELISEEDSNSGASVQFFHDERIEKMVIQNLSRTEYVTHGFRVQVYSSNAQQTAREEAFRIEQRLKTGFPEMNIYVHYSSPFWKVRIGDFLSQEGARVFTEELLQKFPSLKGQTYTVRDRIQLAGINK